MDIKDKKTTISTFEDLEIWKEGMRINLLKQEKEDKHKGGKRNAEGGK